MKRNLLPLLGIAFVVALAASGIFYGLFVGQLKQASRNLAAQQILVFSHTIERGVVLKPADLKLSSWPGALPPGSHSQISDAVGKTVYSSVQENEPITDLQLSPQKAGGGLGITRGMRALSIKVVHSSGLIPFLRAGDHIDIQAVQAHNNGGAALRTILQNVEVLGVHVPEGTRAQFVTATVTVLAAPEDADRVAMADSAASIRILLRNSLDDEKGARPSVALASLFSQTERHPEQFARAAVNIREERVDLIVRVAALSSGLSPGNALQIQAVPNSELEAAPGPSLGPSLGTFKDLASAHVMASNLQAGLVRPGRQWVTLPGNECGLSIRLQRIPTQDHSLRLRIQPEVTLPFGPSGVSTRRAVADVNLYDDQTLVISGLADPGVAPSLAEILFGRPDAGQLAVFITAATTPKAALAVGRP